MYGAGYYTGSVRKGLGSDTGGILEILPAILSLSKSLRRSFRSSNPSGDFGTPSESIPFGDPAVSRRTRTGQPVERGSNSTGLTTFIPSYREPGSGRSTVSIPRVGSADRIRRETRVLRLVTNPRDRDGLTHGLTRIEPIEAPGFFRCQNSFVSHYSFRSTADIFSSDVRARLHDACILTSTFLLRKVIILYSYTSKTCLLFSKALYMGVPDYIVVKG